MATRRVCSSHAGDPADTDVHGADSASVVAGGRSHPTLATLPYQLGASTSLHDDDLRHNCLYSGNMQKKLWCVPNYKCYVIGKDRSFIAIFLVEPVFLLLLRYLLIQVFSHLCVYV